MGRTKYHIETRNWSMYARSYNHRERPITAYQPIHSERSNAKPIKADWGSNTRIENSSTHNTHFPIPSTSRRWYQNGRHPVQPSRVAADLAKMNQTTREERPADCSTKSEQEKTTASIREECETKSREDIANAGNSRKKMKYSIVEPEVGERCS